MTIRPATIRRIVMLTSVVITCVACAAPPSGNPSTADPAPARARAGTWTGSLHLERTIDLQMDTETCTADGSVSLDLRQDGRILTGRIDTSHVRMGGDPTCGSDSFTGASSLTGTAAGDTIAVGDLTLFGVDFGPVETRPHGADIDADLSLAGRSGISTYSGALRLHQP